jgi:hypothetical protein
MRRWTMRSWRPSSRASSTRALIAREPEDQRAHSPPYRSYMPLSQEISGRFCSNLLFHFMVVFGNCMVLYPRHSRLCNVSLVFFHRFPKRVYVFLLYSLDRHSLGVSCGPGGLLACATTSTPSIPMPPYCQTRVAINSECGVLRLLRIRQTLHLSFCHKWSIRASSEHAWW